MIKVDPSWKIKYIRDKRYKANHIINNKINWFKSQSGTLNMIVKDADNSPMKFKTSIRGEHFVLKSYGIPTPSTFNGVWAHITRKQALVLIRELLDYLEK